MDLDTFIFCQDYYFNHIVNKKPIEKYVKEYSKLLRYNTDKVIAFKREYNKYSEEALKLMENNIKYCELIQQKNNIKYGTGNKVRNKIK